MRIETIKKRINSLSVEDKKELAAYIKSSYSIFDDRSISIKACPDCFSSHIVKNGKRKGIQKYVCRDCKKNFNYKTNTVLSKVQKLNKWNEFVEDFISLNITSLKGLKKKLNISEQTAFNWRHKLLSAIFLKTNPKFANETVEFDETYLRLSRKGRRNMAITDKPGYREWRRKLEGDSPYNVKVFFAFGRDSRQLDVCQSHTGRTSLIDMKNYFTADKFKDISVYSDGHNTYRSFFKSNHIPHGEFRSSQHVSLLNKDIHNQAVNSYIRGFKYFVNEHMRGVSTKYLEFYVKWYQFINESKLQAFKKEEVRFNLTDEVCDNLVEDRFGFELYRQSEVGFVRFLQNNGRTNYGDCKNHFYAGKIAA
jgi:transposase-like protein